MENKKPWQSKTVVVNALMGLFGAVALFMPGAASAAEFLTSHAAEISVVWGVANVILRLVTKDKISLGD